jgi:hypothetical protein
LCTQPSLVLLTTHLNACTVQTVDHQFAISHATISFKVQALHPIKANVSDRGGDDDFRRDIPHTDYPTTATGGQQQAIFLLGERAAIELAWRVVVRRCALFSCLS